MNKYNETMDEYHEDEYNELIKIYYDKETKYPRKIIIKNPTKNILSYEYTVDTKKKLRQRIKDIEEAKQARYKCFICNKYRKENKQGHFHRMDKRERGDGLFGYVFICETCGDAGGDEDERKR